MPSLERNASPVAFFHLILRDIIIEHKICSHHNFISRHMEAFFKYIKKIYMHELVLLFQ